MRVVSSPTASVPRIRPGPSRLLLQLVFVIASLAGVTSSASAQTMTVHWADFYTVSVDSSGRIIGSGLLALWIETDWSPNEYHIVAEISVEILDSYGQVVASDTVVYEEEEALEAWAFPRDSSNALSMSLPVPPNQLPPGNYTVRVLKHMRCVPAEQYWAETKDHEVVVE